jgi:hypothetical protein
MKKREWWQVPTIESLSPEQAKKLRDKLHRRYLYVESGVRVDQRTGKWLRSRDSEQARRRLQRIKKLESALDKLALTVEDKRFLNLLLGVQMVAKAEAASCVHPSESAMRLAEQVAALPRVHQENR